MKIYISIALVALLLPLGVFAQDHRLSFPDEDQGHDHAHSHGGKVDSMKMRIEEAYMWKIDSRYGNRIAAVRDSARFNYHQSTIVDGQDIAMGYTGNLGSALQSKLLFSRPTTTPQFTFLQGMNKWRTNPEDQLYHNTKVPYSEIFYQTGGGAQSKEELFKFNMSSNFGSRVNVGGNFEYLYARGYYTNSHNKQVNYDLNASYIGDNYKMHAFYGFNNFTNTENGGITNPIFITDPDSEEAEQLLADQGITLKGSMDIPVRFSDPMWNKLRGRHFLVSNRYDFGDADEEFQDTDSVMKWRKKENYVAPASVVLTTHYNDQRRTVKSNSSSMDNLYTYYHQDENGQTIIKNSPKYNDAINDYMSYWSLKNTLALSMNEGFRPWMKFGLAAFIEYDTRKFLIPTENYKASETASNNALFVGGALTSSKGKHLKYNAKIEKDLLNNDFGLEGDIATHFQLKGRDYSVKANSYFKNTTANFFQERFSSKYWNWNKDLSDVRRLFIGGEIASPSTGTTLSGGVETLQKYIYYNDKGIIDQKSGSVQVISLRLDQKLKAGIFHWDNQVAFQTTSDAKALPLPKFSIYSNVYLQTMIAGVMSFQLGVDAHLHSKYYAPGYEPLTMQFYNQQDYKIGAFPITTAYANIQMKHLRFFAMAYNLAEGMGNSNYFSLYRYPVNPRIIKFGITWKFND